MIELFHLKRDIPFMRFARSTIFFSVAFIVASIALLATKGLNLGVDFTGGTVMEIGYPGKAADVHGIRETLARAGHADAQVQNFGTASEVLVRLPVKAGVTSAQLSEKVLGILKVADPSVQLRRVEFVGPQVGEELAEEGVIAALIAMGGILLYVMLRFTLKFSLGSITATVHDVLVIMGFFSITRLEFDLNALAAVLAIMGYSLNDTIVILDRIRENFRTMRKAEPVTVVNASLNQTLSRTINTSLLTLLAVLALLFFGGEMIHGFALALTIGIVVGVYSSIYIAGAMVLALGATREELLPIQKEGAALDDRP